MASSSPTGDQHEPPVGVETDKDSRLWAMLSHLSGLMLGFLGPLIIWLIKKDESAFVEDQAKEALNFQISLLIAYAVIGAVGTATMCFGFLLMPILYVFQIVFEIIAAVKSNDGEYYRYPYTLRLIK